MGNRIGKKVTQGGVLQSYTTYALDAQGNPMATYELKMESGTKKMYLSERMIYGSTRLGVESGPSTQLSNGTPLTPTTRYSLSVGDKRYELANHLGNVLNVVSDRKIPLKNPANNTVIAFNPNVIQYTDYFPFGMTMPGKNGGSEYRFGFNGMEEDKEVKGDYNSYDFGARMYDSRLGRFLSRDRFAREFPNESPYGYGGNSPILFIDINGDFKIVITEEAKKQKGSEIKIKRFEEIVKDLPNYLNENPSVLNEIQKQTGLSKEQIMKDAVYDEGPTIFIGVRDGGVEASPEDYEKGGFTIDYTLVESLENDKAKDMKDVATLNLMFGALVLHEYTHFGDRKKNKGKISGQTDGDVFNADGSVNNGAQNYPSKYDHRGSDVDQKTLGKEGMLSVSGEVKDLKTGERTGKGYFFSAKDRDTLKNALNFGKKDPKSNKRTVLPKDQQ